MAMRFVVRPGARFSCHRGGLCCSDLHFLGPLEADRALVEHRLPVFVDPARGEHRLPLVEDGHCAFLRPSGCVIHEEDGFEAKPSMCRRFPFSVTATPTGARVATAHRCPCRTLGERAPLDPVALEAMLSDRTPVEDHRVGDRINFGERTSVSFATYLAWERRALDALEGGAPALEVLDMPPALPALGQGSWESHANDWIARTREPGRALGAMNWYGVGLLALCQGAEVDDLPRPWAPEFDLAEQTGSPRTAQAVLNDYLADEIWSLRWTETGSLHRARSDFALRMMVADILTASIAREGRRPDRAAAEAVMITELSTNHPRWLSLVRDNMQPLALSESGTKRLEP